MNELDHVVTDNIKTNKYQSYYAIYNVLMFDTNSFNLSSGTRHPLPVVTVTLQGSKKHRATTVACLTLLWDRGATDSMIKRKHTKYYERNMRYNTVEYGTDSGMHCLAHDVKVPFYMPDFYSSKMINHCFHVDNEKGELGIGYDMIIRRDLMVQLGLTANFKHQFLQYDGTTLNIKEPRDLLGKSDLNKSDICKVVMQTSEPASTREATEIMVKILNSTYAKAYLKQVADNTTQLNAEERTQLLSLIEDSEDLFDGTLGDWSTGLVDLDLKPGSKPFNSRYYPVPRINKETFSKELKHLVEIGVLTPVQQSQYGTPVFIIPKKEGAVRFITEYHRLDHKLVRKPYLLP